jgi:hypothetical protein
MRLVLYSTRATGYWFKAPSWEHGQKVELEEGKVLELEGDDLAELELQISEGHPLRFEQAVEPKGKKSPK